MPGNTVLKIRTFRTYCNLFFKIYCNQSLTIRTFGTFGDIDNFIVTKALQFVPLKKKFFGDG